MAQDSPAETPDEGVEHFAPTGGRITGILGLVVAAAFLLGWLLDLQDVPAWVGAGALLVAALAWASLLRPRVSTSSETLYLRNMFETIHVPLAAIDEVVVRQVLVVRVGEKRFVCPAVGRKLRKVIRAPRPQQLVGPTIPESMDDVVGSPGSADHVPTDIDYADHVEQRLRLLIAEARERHGIRAYSDEADALARDVRRQPAWPEIAAVAGSAVLVVVAVLA